MYGLNGMNGRKLATINEERKEKLENEMSKIENERRNVKK